ncbi:uncharacterized protein PFL1_02230 [Pseudozyma flocculosa PF-1]|uniref:uncharacterized protein n=1 Tax=Pseudozyma flocculosa PF-1 TaxID=1277687 RepID=UPI000455FFDF|nr:uncharacterized protein PFL1_02230 [Pseudozyma flocculosa PF-1]EPQ30113.1 hypothetical protein PFL1_02230 [Pseudozyma flocculosa PF-1]
MTTSAASRPGSGDWSRNALSNGNRPAPSESATVSVSGSTPSILQTSEESFRLEGSAAGEESFSSPASSSEPVNANNSAVVGRDERARGDQDGVGADGATPEDLHAKIEKKRFEHEQQRALQRKAFEQQMALLEMQQQEEERTLLEQQQLKDRSGRAQLEDVINSNSVAASAPTTPLRETNGASRHQQLLGARQTIEARPHGPTLLGAMPSHSEPEEGLNGSNSQDGHPDTAPQGRLAAALASQRRATPQQDLSGAFDKMVLSSGPRGGLAAAHLRAQLAQQDAPRSSSAAPLTSIRSSDSAATTQAPAVAHPGQNSAHQHSGSEGFTPVFNERFLFDDELDNEDSAFVKRYNLHEDDDKFPILVRRDSFPDVLSASSAALDLAPLSQAARNARVGSVGGGSGSDPTEWPNFGSGGDGGQRDRKARHGQGETVAGGSGAGNGGEVHIADGPRRSAGGGEPERASPSGTISRGPGANAYPLPSPSPRIPQAGRDSPAIHVGFTAAAAASRGSGAGPVSPTPVGAGSGSLTNGSRFASHMSQPHDFIGHSDFDPLQPQQPNPARKNDGGGGSSLKPHVLGAARDGSSSFPSFSLGAFSNASGGSESPSRFGPYSPAAFDADSTGRGGSNGSRPNSGFFDAFNPAAPAAAAHHHHHAVFGPVPGLPIAGSGGAANLKHARKGGNVVSGAAGGGGELDAATRLEDLQGEIFALCKDQHGCRYLQKKLEEGLPSHRDMIFAETFHHFAELMTDPFGNYLCQKMLEYCTDDQRNRIVESVAPELVTISLNMHGTRAVQKTIDFLSTSRQIHSIIMALSMNVVTLIKDLNGNHVIQKCLNRLGAEDNQFIYNAVAAHCVEVATHRHGCCVLQRCIDHASDSQRIQLVAEITYNALTLVQDPFGNYVVQYVLDLCDQRFTDAVIRQFVGNVCLLSVQKFSSNVIEKCIRVSDPSIRKQLIEELLNRSKLEKLLRDSFANYVVQTSLDYADPVQRMRLVECIRPILPVIRNTPYGKRIQSKLQRDNLDLGPSAGGGAGGMPFSLLQQQHHHHHHHHHQQQQLHAMAAMAANRQGPSGNPSDFLGINAYGQPGLHSLPPPHHHPYPQGLHHQQPGGRSLGHQPQLHMGPPAHHQHHQHHPHQLYGAGAGGPSQHHPAHPSANHGLPPPLNFSSPSTHSLYGGGLNQFQGAAPHHPPMGVHGAPSGGFPSSSSGGFGPY